LKSIALSKGYSGIVKLLETSIDDNHLSAAVQYAADMTNEYYATFEEDPDGKTWSAKISRLI
jgi:hypothetical protein